MSSEIKNCIHCKTMAVDIARGLCRPCWRKPEIRCKYPLLHNRRKASTTTPEDITMEALEALIAERLPTMPRDRSDKAAVVGVYIPRAVTTGRGIDSRSYRMKPRRGNW